LTVYRSLKKNIYIFLFLLFPLFCPAASSFAATAEVEVLQSLDRYPAGGSYPITIRIRISDSWFLHGTGEGGELIPTRLAFEEKGSARVDNLRFPPPLKKKFDYTEDQVAVFKCEISVKADLLIAGDAAEGENILTGTLSYQACSLKSCRPPEDVPVKFSCKVAPRVAEAIPVKSKKFDAFSGDARAGGSWNPGAGLLLTLLGLLLGGMALNLTPCIYPLIPITVSYFGGRGATGTRTQTALHALFYMLGLAFTNSLLGAFAGLTGGMLGSVLQSPLILIIVALIILCLAASFFGLWEIRLPLGLTKAASRGFAGFFGAFFMGLTLGLVAAPCLGPFVLGLLTWVAQKGDPFTGFLYFFILSIGMGIPLSLLAIFSGGISKLPVSGDWMVWIKKALGWVLVLMAGYMLGPLFPGPFANALLMSVILLGAGLHLGWVEKAAAEKRGFLLIRKVTGIALITAAVLFTGISVHDKEGVAWLSYKGSLLTEALNENRPVMLDFYADWCSPCKAMEKDAFRDQEVVSLSKKFVTLRVDLTRARPYQKELIDKYRVRGVPTVIFLDGGGKEIRSLRIEAHADKNEIKTRMKQVIEKD